MNEIYRDPSINGFCMRQKISRSTYYNLRAAGQGPREYHVGKQVRISPDAEAEWVRQREAETSEATEAA